MNYFALSSYVFISMVTPGPNTILSMEEGKRVGFPRVYYFIGGIATGFMLSGFLCAAVTAMLLELLPDIGVYLKVLGTAYILYLAVRALRANRTLDVEEAQFSGRAAFVSGVLLQFVNVKALMMLLTVLSGFIFPATREPSHIALFVFAICATSGAVCSLWALCGAVFRRLFVSHAKTVNIVIALLLIYCAVSIWR